MHRGVRRAGRRPPVAALAGDGEERHEGDALRGALPQQVLVVSRFDSETFCTHTTGAIFCASVLRPHLGFCEPTAARRIGFAESLDFEKLHEATYRAYGFDLVDVPAGPLTERVGAVQAVIVRNPG